MSYRLFLLRGVCLVALAFTSASLADQTLGGGTFCSFESGCDSVTSSEYGSLLGIPLPYVGIVGFTAILGLSLIGGERNSRLARRLALLAGAAGAALILVQLAVLGRTCLLCLIVDSCAILMGLAAIGTLSAEPSSSASRGVWSVLGVLAALVPLAYAYSDVQPDPPAWVTAEWVQGRITVVEVTDFECEHCRQADEHLRNALKNRADVKLVRIPIEMPKHANSRSAAVAFRAAKAQGHGDEMAEALFAATALTPADCRLLAEKLGLDLKEYDRVVADPATERDVGTASLAARAAGPGVPLIWIQSRLSYGMPTVDNFDRPLSQARPYRAK